MNSNSTIYDTKFQEIYIISGGLGIIICSYSFLKLIIKYCRVLNNENDNLNTNKNKKEKVIQENDIDDYYDDDDDDHDDHLPSYNELYSSGINF